MQPDITGENTRSLSRLRLIRGAIVLVAGAILVLLLLGIVDSRIPMRGAELFGALAKKIKGNPGATAYISLGAGAALWLSLAVLAADQELMTRRKQ